MHSGHISHVTDETFILSPVLIFGLAVSANIFAIFFLYHAYSVF